MMRKLIAKYEGLLARERAGGATHIGGWARAGAGRSGRPVGAMAGNLGGAAQSTMHDFVQRRPLAQTQAAVATQATVVACGPPAAAVADHRRRATCDPDADGPLSVDGLPLRRDRIGQWVFPRSEAYPCVAISPSSPPGAVRLNDRRCAPQDEAVPG
jgi:hypothetical protein